MNAYKIMKQEHIIYDSAWKEILEAYFQDFILFFFPEIYEEIDWKRGYESLDKEFQKIIREAKIEKRFVDKLIKVYRQTGEETWVLIHIEMQTQVDQALAERMYVYNSLIYLRHKKQVMSIAVLGDENSHWRPDRFAYTIWGSQVSLQFKTVKLLDYCVNIEELKSSSNPFAFFVASHLKTLETRKNMDKRLEWKKAITKHMVELGMPQEKAVSLFRFIDFLIYLPEDLEKEYTEEIHRFQEEKKMPFIAPFEEMAMKKGFERGKEEGRQEGRQEGSLEEAREVLLEFLEMRFMNIPSSLYDSICKIDDLSHLRDMRKNAITASSLDEFIQSLNP